MASYSQLDIGERISIDPLVLCVFFVQVVETCGEVILLNILAFAYALPAILRSLVILLLELGSMPPLVRPPFFLLVCQP